MSRTHPPHGLRHRESGALAARGPPRLPSLRGVPGGLATAGTTAHTTELARALVRHGTILRRDVRPGTNTPSMLVQNAIGRIVAHLNRGPESPLLVRAFVRPWQEILDELGDGPSGRETRWGVGIAFEDTYRLRVRPLVDAVGEAAAGAVLSRLMADTPLYIAEPSELEWIIDGWRDAQEDPPGDEEAVRKRAVEAWALAQRIEGIVAGGVRSPRPEVPGRVLRRLLDALSALDRSRPPSDDSAWRETAGADWAIMRPVVQLVWDDGCPLDHAADEADLLHDQDGSFPQPQLLWLVDPATPGGMAAWDRWLLALRQVRAASLVVRAIARLSSDSSP